MNTAIIELIIILVSIFAWVLLLHRTLTTPWMDQSSLKCTPWWRTAIFARYIESQWFGKRDSKASSEFFVLEEFIESPLTPLSVKYAWERSGMVLYDISKISGGCTIWRNISTENPRHCQCDSGNLGAIILHSRFSTRNPDWGCIQRISTHLTTGRTKRMIAQITTGVVCGLIVVASARITEAQLLQRRQMNQPKQLLLLKRPQRGEGWRKWIWESSHIRIWYNL